MKLNLTQDYHRFELQSLGWELTLCNILDEKSSPCRRILKRNASYGELLYFFLSRVLPEPMPCRFVEIGGGYGYLMRDILELNPDGQAYMVEISPFLLEKQRGILSGKNVEFLETDVLELDGNVFQGADLVVMNEILGDLPTLVDIPADELLTVEEKNDPLWRRFSFLRDKYHLDTPLGGYFNFNIGAIEILEKICSSNVPYIFICEHSCESFVPPNLESIIHFSSSGFPERISLKGHCEYTVKFSHLENVGNFWGYEMMRGPAADFIPLNWTEVKRLLFESLTECDESEILHYFIEDLFKYEYLLLYRPSLREGKRSFSKKQKKSCLRCGKCCLAHLQLYVKEEDIERWKKEQRGDILEKLEHVIWAGDHFVNDTNGQYLYGCPFLSFEGGYATCTIYTTRPNRCRSFVPGSSEICPLWGKKVTKNKNEEMFVC
ncbi:MAG: YkgJ family cysteine cluster protein [Syntrophales bacterium]|nr:YkgJ family cysteine cluster protein [Syntrophales bacterium]